MKKKTKHKNIVRRPSGKPGELFGTIGKTLFLCMILGVAAVFWYIASWANGVLAETPTLNTNLIFREGTTIIFDRYGQPFSEGDGQRSEWVQFNEIAPVMIDAILAIEDSRFFDHYGVDWSRTLAAVMYTAESMITGSQSMQGGSTLTQQLVNQTHLLHEDGTRDNSIDRKLQEILLAMQIEREFSKEQIIEAYLNYAPFGGRIFGVQAAAEFYFGVDAADLTLSQAATLAGLVQLPNQYRPDENAVSAQARRNTVLYLMVRHGFITQNLADLAAAEPLTDLLVFREVATAHTARMNESFVNLVYEEMETVFGITDPHAGYQVFTTLDPEAQEFLHNALHTDSHIAWPNDDMQQAVVMIGNDGAIRAIGGRDLMNRQNIQRGFNLPVHMERQVGSTSKPIWAYGPAFELLGWGTGSMIDDRAFGFDWTLPTSNMVHNWDVRYRGRVSVRNAMDWSWNVPAILAYLAVVEEKGQEAMDDFVNSLGIPTPEERGFSSAYAIGGNHRGFSVLQMAGAYSAFATGGIFNRPFTITRIITPDGEIIYGDEYHHSERVMSESTAYMMSSILRSALTQGTGGQALIPGQWVAGKTGTTNFDQWVRDMFPQTRGGVPDSWFVGYSMDYTIAVWTGYPSTTDGTFLNFPTQQAFSQRMFRYMMTEFNTAGDRQPQRPADVVNKMVEWGSGTYNGEVCAPSDYTPSGALRDGNLNRRNMAWQMSELFVRTDEPMCVSDRFEAPEIPENFEVMAGGGLTLDFSWDHISNLPMTLEEAMAARDQANSLSRRSTTITEELLELEVSEDAAEMMIDKITAIGETEYVVMGRVTSGPSRELGTTTDNEISITLSMADAAIITEFYVVTRFEASGRMSEPSNSVPNRDLIDLNEIEVQVPNIVGWPREQLEEWREFNNVTIEITEVYSDEVASGYVVATNPAAGATLSLDQVLQVTISRGPEPFIPGIPGLPEIPGMPGGQTPGGPGGADQSPGTDEDEDTNSGDDDEIFPF